MKSALYLPPSKRTLLILALLLLVYAFGLHWNHLSEGPAGMHLWTQSDHYALARGFVNNGLDFFHPQTFVYNYRYPEVFDPNNQSLITAVDFPIHNYIPAAIMSLSGSDSPAIMSIYMLLVSVVGLVYLFRFAHLFNRSETLSLLIVAIVACSPVFAFYQIRFIPSVPTLSTAIIGLYYGFSHYKTGKFSHFVWGMVFLTLSAMTRMTYLIPLLAFAGQEFFFVLKRPENRWRKVITAGLCFSAAGGYMLWNTWLRNTYGGIFLNAFMPATSWAQFADILVYIYQHWKYEYVTKAHYAVIAAIVLFLIVRRFRNDEPGPKRLPVRWFLFFLLAGSAAFFVLMAHQFRAHDYYALDVFFVPGIAVLCVLSERMTPVSSLTKQLFAGFTVLAVPSMIWLNVQTQNNRIESEKWGLNEMVVRNFKDSKHLLKGIPKDAAIVMIDPLPRNIPFYYMDRTGYVVMRNDPRHLKAALELPVTYYVFQNELFLSDIYKVYPEIIRRLQPIRTDGKITVCRKIAPDKSATLFGFLGLNDQQPLFAARLAEENVPEWEVRGEQVTGYAGQFGIGPEQEFGPVLKLRKAEDFRKARVLYVSGTIRCAENVPQFVVSLVENGEMKLYKAFPMVEFPPGEHDRRPFQYLVPLPETTGKDVEVSAYIWNTGRVHYSVADVEAKVF